MRFTQDYSDQPVDKTVRPLASELREWGITPKKPDNKPKKVIPVVPRHLPPPRSVGYVKPWYHPLAAAPATIKQITLKMIQRAVANHFGCKIEALLKHQRRDLRIIFAKSVAHYLARELTDKSLLVVAREFNRDHTSILYSVRKVLPVAFTNPDVVAIRQQILGDVARSADSQDDPNQLALEV
jgi:hypothetical protein